VVEAGCGWGALARHMAKHYGVTVKAYNISRQQLAYARDRARQEGLVGRVEYIEDDYRNIRGQYDAFVSVGMLEHVGVDNYPMLGAVAKKALRKHGRGLIHSIGRNRPGTMSAWIERRIFPGAHPPCLSEMMQIFEPNTFSVLDVENLRLHYARTLAHWLERFEANVDKVEAMTDPAFVRAWRLYLAGSMASFTAVISSPPYSRPLSVGVPYVSTFPGFTLMKLYVMSILKYVNPSFLRASIRSAYFLGSPVPVVSA